MKRAMQAAAVVLAGSVATQAIANESHPFGWRVGTDGQGTIQVDFLWEMTHKAWDYAGSFPGAVDDTLAFEEYLFVIPETGFVPFDQAGAEIEIVFTSFDTGVYFRDPADASTPINTAGSRFSVGTTGSEFFADAIWQVDPFTPGFDLSNDIWEASFYFTDTTGTYADSQVYTYLLEPVLEVPAPSAIMPLGAGALLLARRRR